MIDASKMSLDQRRYYKRQELLDTEESVQDELELR